MGEGGTGGRFGWLKRHIPTRDTVHQHRLLRPLAPHLTEPALWRLTRRSVPRAVAIGLFVGVIVPIMHTLLAALFAIPLRANVAVAAVVTLVINPLTIPPLYYAAYRVGVWELHQNAPLATAMGADRMSTELGRILFWTHYASGPIALGILTIAVGASLLGYGATAVAWRSRLANRWRIRRRRNGAAA